MMDAPSRRRVKLYMLNEDRTWGDQGTGHVTSLYVEKLKGTALVVRSETDGCLLLESKIQPLTAYQKQQDTLIVWSELDNDYALSFQEKAGCDEIWEKICQVQGKDPALDLTQECSIGEDMADDMGEEEHFRESLDPPIDLPPCELGKLNDISEVFSASLITPNQREKLSLALETTDYIKKLLDLFRMCEDLDHSDGLHHLFDIFKSIFSLNKSEILEIIFNEDNILNVIGVLEYDPGLPKKPQHREFLRHQAKFKQVVPTKNSDLIQKIHQTYRMQYIQDMILPAPSVFEDNMLSALTSLIYFNKAEIVSMLQDDVEFLSHMFMQIKDDETDDGRRRDLVMFLKEFCAFSQNLQPESKAIFLKKLMNFDVLKALEAVLGFDDDCTKWAALDVFTYLLDSSPTNVREFIVRESQQQDDDELLINLVIEQLISDTDAELGGAVQLMGTLRTIIDPENMLGTANKNEKSDFLNFFYKHSMHVLTAPLYANTIDDKPSKDDYRTCHLLSLILELLSFCIEHHSYHMKNYTMNKDLLRRVLVLMRSEHKFLVLASLRLLRKVIGLKDEFYNRYIVRGDLFRPVVEAFVANGHRYNLQNSAVIELFDYIRQEDIKTLLRYFVEKFYNNYFDSITYTETFRQLKRRYEQDLENFQGRSLTGHDGAQSYLREHLRQRRENRTVDEDEEMWFETDEEYDESDPVMPVTEILKSKADAYDFNRFLERKTLVSKETDFTTKDSPRLMGRANPINIALSSRTSPPNSPVAPTSSPTGSPLGSALSPVLSPRVTSSSADRLRNSPSDSPKAVQTGVLMGLVDYPDDEEDDDEVSSTSGMSAAAATSTVSDTADGPPAAKRQHLVT